MYQLNLTVPVQHDYTDPTVEIDVTRLRAWLDDLPIMNLMETVRLVIGALNALNEQKLEAELRFSCLEIYRTVVLRLFETVDPLHIRQLALSRRQRQDTIKDAAYLFRSLASGYKLIIMELQRQRGGQGSPLFGQVINRAVEQLGYALQDCYRFYRAVPDYLITELHQLYHAARRDGLLGIVVAGEQGDSACSTVVLYQASMLLSLVDAERLVEGEVNLVFDVLQQHANKCRIVQGNSWSGNGEGLFLLDLDSESLPVPCSSITSPATAGAPFLLDATSLLDQVREEFARTPEKIRQRSPEALVLARLLPGTFGASLRREQRHRDGRWVSMLLGLPQVHSYLLRESGKQTVDGQQVISESVEARVLDASDNGMKLYWAEGGAGDARVGDLLGIVEGEGNQTAMQLYSIRSLQVSEDVGVEAGVQLISGGLGAVYCSTPEAAGVTAAALFLPADEEHEISATLVTDSGLYAQGSSLGIDVGGREIRVSVGRLVSDSPVFDRFEFSAE